MKCNPGFSKKNYYQMSITNSQPQEAGLIIDHLLVPLFRLLKLKWQYSGVTATAGQPNLAFSLLRCIQLNVEARPDYHRGENKFSIDPLHTEHTSNTHCSNTLNKYTIPVPFTLMDVCKISTSCYFFCTIWVFDQHLVSIYTKWTK